MTWEKTRLDFVGAGQFKLGGLLASEYWLELNPKAQILVLGTMRHLNR